MSKTTAPSVRDQFGQFFAEGSGRKLTLEQKLLAKTIQKGLKKVEAELTVKLQFSSEIADVSTRYLFDAGGKRVRPSLLMLVAQLGKGITSEIVTAAQVVEITHLATLYHDDVMDEAELRRGVTAVQKVWSNSVAILAGDLLLSRSSTMMTELGIEAIRLQAKTFERLCLGQLHETLGPAADEDPIQHYLQVLSDKTGSLLGLAAQLGVIYSGAPQEYVLPLLEYGEKVGVAFQLVDDVIDLSAESEKTGKNAGTDLRRGVDTLPVLKLRQLAETDAAAKDLLQRLDDTANVARFDEAVQELRNHAVTKETIAEAELLSAEAIAAIQILPAGAVKTALESFARNMVNREA